MQQFKVFHISFFELKSSLLERPQTIPKYKPFNGYFDVILEPIQIFMIVLPYAKYAFGSTKASGDVGINGEITLLSESEFSEFENLQN